MESVISDSSRAFESSKILKFTWYVKENHSIASRGLIERGAPRVMQPMPEAFRRLFVRPDFYDAFDALCRESLGGEASCSCDLISTHGNWKNLTLEILERSENGDPLIIMGILENTNELHLIQQENRTVTEVCRFAIESHYEEAALIDLEKNTITPVLDNSTALSGADSPQSIAHKDGISRSGNDVGLCISEGSVYDQEILRLIEDRACTDQAREGLRTLLPENLAPLLEQNGKHIIRIQLINNEGKPSWKQINCIFFGEDHNQVILLSSDVQSEEDVKEQLRIAALEAQEASRAKSAFLANMSHEIRTPMNAIVGISEILLSRELPDEVRDYITTIQNSGSSLLGIINDILDFSKIETGKLELNEAEYMLSSLLMDVSNVISVRLSGKPVRFMMDLDPSLPNRYIGDDIRLKQILINLIGNSVKFTREGYIQLRIEGEETEDRRFRLRFEVKDTGIGIREEDMGRLFKNFSQVDTKRNRYINGSGLGLSISKDLAELMGGDLTVESTYGKGSTFTVTILQKNLDREKIGEVHNKNVRILIYEQNETIIYSLCRTLENLGLEYDVCRDPYGLRDYDGVTHVLIRRKNFYLLREKLTFMFPSSNIFLILEIDETASSQLIQYKQLQLPLICMQLINALNGEAIVTSVKAKAFDRSQIVPLPFARILIVDDNETNLQVAQGLMAPYQMKIDTATNGFRAIEMVKSINYNAIFMDHMMPEMDGIEATRYIRNLAGDYYRRVPIIALTANAMNDAREMFEHAGMDDFVAKPIEMAELNRVLKTYVQPQAPEDITGPDLEAKAGEPVVIQPARETDMARQLEDLHGPIAGVNMQQMLETYGGSVPIYHNILKTYYYDIESRKPQLEGYYKEKDLENFIISVHAIKSASYGAGAKDLGHLAEQLETAGKAGDWEKIHDLYPRFMEAMEFIETNVGRYVTRYLERGGASKEETLDAFSPDDILRLKAACEDMDYMKAEDILREMNEKKYPDELDLLLIKMIGLCEAFEYDRLEEIISQLPQQETADTKE